MPWTSHFLSTLRASEALRQKHSDVSTELRPHQERVLRRILDPNQGGLVVAHGLGSGKTLSSIAAAEALGGDTTVLVPASLRENYGKEIDKHTDGDLRATYTLDSVQRVGRNEDVPPGDTLIIDEAHRLRNPSSKTRQFLRKKAPEFGKRLLLTATPVYNKPHDIAGPINIAAAESVLPASPGDFKKKFVGKELVKPGWFAKTFKGVKPGVRDKIINESELLDVFGKYVDYQKNSTEGFPERVDEVVHVDMADEQKKVYDYLMGQAPAWLRHKVKKGLPPNKQESKALNTFLTGTRHVSTTPASYVADMDEETALQNSPKVRKAFDRFMERTSKNPEHKAVVYANFLDGLDHYKKLLDRSGVPYGVFTGKEKKRDRDQAVRDYNEGKLKALLVSSAGGEGLDLKGTRQIQVLEPHFNDEKLEQVIGRGIRYGSHAHLPEEDRNVAVEKFLATLPKRKGLKRLFLGKDQGKSVDQYLLQMAAEKKAVADQLTSLMEQATERHKTSSQRQKNSEGPVIDQESVDVRPRAEQMAERKAEALRRQLRERWPDLPESRVLEIERVLSQARPGDVLISGTREQDLGNRFLRLFTGDMQHASAVVGEDGTVIEANSKGVRTAPSYRTASKEIPPVFSVFRPKTPLTAQQQQQFASRLQSRIGEEYSDNAFDRLMFSAPMPAPMANYVAGPRCLGPTCSTLPASAYAGAGVRTPGGLSANAVSPVDFAGSRRFEQVATSVDDFQRPIFGRGSSRLARMGRWGGAAAAAGYGAGKLFGNRKEKVSFSEYLQDKGSSKSPAGRRKEGKRRRPVTKTSFFSVGGRGVDYGPDGIQLSTGYTNLLGVVPFPKLGVRFGSRDGLGLSVGIPGIEISRRARDSFRDRPGVSGLTDILIEKIEDSEKRSEVAPRERNRLAPAASGIAGLLGGGLGFAVGGAAISPLETAAQAAQEKALAEFPAAAGFSNIGYRARMASYKGDVRDAIGAAKEHGINPDAIARAAKKYRLLHRMNLFAMPAFAATGAALGGLGADRLLRRKESEAWQRKEGKSPKGGLNEKGRASLRAKGQDIKAPVTAKAAKKSPAKAKRRKSFCARMGGMEGPMKDDKGRPTRKAKALKRWDCKTSGLT